MKKGHYILFFALFLLLCGMRILVERNVFVMADEQEMATDRILYAACENGARKLAEGRNAGKQSWLQETSEAFFLTLLSGLEQEESFNSSELANVAFYVPVLLITDTDGFYIGSASKDDLSGLTRDWSICYPYVYEDREFIYRFSLNDDVTTVKKSTDEIIHTTFSTVRDTPMLTTYYTSSGVFASEESFFQTKQAAIMMSIEEMVVKAVAEHNHIASQMGISYYFTSPKLFADGGLPMDYPSITAIFQGFPINTNRGIYYYGLATSAAYIMLQKQYTVEMPGADRTVTPYALMHEPGCSHVGESGGKVIEDIGGREAVKMYGAYACPYCLGYDTSVPQMP